jgi:hypothetical protein
MEGRMEDGKTLKMTAHNSLRGLLLYLELGTEEVVRVSVPKASLETVLYGVLRELNGELKCEKTIEMLRTTLEYVDSQKN